MKNLIITAFACMVALIGCSQPQTTKTDVQITAPDENGVVYSDENVVFTQLDEHTWHGKGNKCYNESVYLIEGEKRALLIDAGVDMPGLRKIVESIVGKSVELVISHVHSDHTGIAINEWESLWMNAADEVNVPSSMPDYKGEKRYMADGQVFELGGRDIEVFFGPGHTPGSTIFIDKAAKYGFSSDAFGSTNLLVFTNLSTEASTCDRIMKLVEKYGLTHFYPGHFGGQNLETPQRIKDIKTLCEGVLDGTIEKETDLLNGMLRYFVDGDGIRVRFSGDGIR